MKTFDYIIVGQGLAGSTLAYYLLKSGKSILVIDENKPETSSKIAAGIINPVVFKRLTLSWNVANLLPEANSFFKEIEQLSTTKIYNDITIYRIFNSNDDYNFWQKQCNEPHLIDYLSLPEKNSFSEFFTMPFGYGKVLNAAFVDTKAYINTIRQFLIEKSAFKETHFNFNDLKLLNDSVQYQNVKAKKIIFCRGWEDVQNPFFKHLEIFKLTKGEVLTVQPENAIDFNDEVSKGVFFLKHIDSYKLGATYSWNDLSEIPTEQAKQELLNKYKSFGKQPLKIIAHHAGIRPTVKDRRPVVGFLPDNAHVGIFNGLGTKGAMIAPWLAREFTNHLLHRHKIENTIDVKRFEK